MIYFDLIYEYSVRKGSDGFTREIYKNLKTLIIKEEKLEINESLSKSGHWKKGQQHTHKEKRKELL